MDPETSRQLQVRLLTWQQEIAVPDTVLSVPAAIQPQGLNQLVHKLLEEDRSDYQEQLASKKFDFLLGEDFLRGPLDEAATQVGARSEGVLELRYVDSLPPPEPHKNFNHDDWVAGVAAKGGFVLTACYDHTVNIFDIASGEKKLTIPGHQAPARAVAWVSLDDEGKGVFASCSHDQTVLLYRWNAVDNAVEDVNACRGHQRSVDCLGVNPSGALLASGSFDTTLKVWGTSVQTSNHGQEDGSEDKGESSKKKSKSDKKLTTRTPIMTLGGHKEGISGVTWLGDKEVATASWDHTIKIWDCEMGGMKEELVGDRSFFALSYSADSKAILTASADSAVRLYDSRSGASESVIVKAKYTSHKGWVTSVCWCQSKQHLFVSGGHDNLVKMWDSRSCKTPLYDLKGHEDKVMCCNWNNPEYVVSGGSDNAMKIFKAGTW